VLEAEEKYLETENFRNLILKEAKLLHRARGKREGESGRKLVFQTSFLPLKANVFWKGDRNGRPFD
jgi:hypothetical protein